MTATPERERGIEGSHSARRLARMDRKIDHMTSILLSLEAEFAKRPRPSIAGSESPPSANGADGGMEPPTLLALAPKAGGSSGTRPAADSSASEPTE